MSRTLSSPPVIPISLDEVQHLVLEDASWNLYETLLKEIGDRPIRMTYDDGRLEIMSPLPEHEDPKKFIGRMIEMLTLELDMPINHIPSEGQIQGTGARRVLLFSRRKKDARTQAA